MLTVAYAALSSISRLEAVKQFYLSKNYLLDIVGVY